MIFSSTYPRCLLDALFDVETSLGLFISSFAESESYWMSSSVSVLRSCDVGRVLFDVAISRNRLYHVRTIVIENSFHRCMYVRESIEGEKKSKNEKEEEGKGEREEEKKGQILMTMEMVSFFLLTVKDDKSIADEVAACL